jgi:hypothetical protein
MKIRLNGSDRLFYEVPNGSYVVIYLQINLFEKFEFYDKCKLDIHFG